MNGPGDDEKGDLAQAVEGADKMVEMYKDGGTMDNLMNEGMGDSAKSESGDQSSGKDVD